MPRPEENGSRSPQDRVEGVGSTPTPTPTARMQPVGAGAPGGGSWGEAAEPSEAAEVS